MYIYKVIYKVFQQLYQLDLTQPLLWQVVFFLIMRTNGYERPNRKT